jgi:hypothetical protein
MVPCSLYWISLVMLAGRRFLPLGPASSRCKAQLEPIAYFWNLDCFLPCLLLFTFLLPRSSKNRKWKLTLIENPYVPRTQNLGRDKTLCYFNCWHQSTSGKVLLGKYKGRGWDNKTMTTQPCLRKWRRSLGSQSREGMFQLLFSCKAKCSKA